MLPFSGTYAQLGENIAIAFELLLAEKGGKLGGRTVEVIRLDDESDPSKAVQNVNRLLNRDKADVLVGTVHSGVVMALVPRAMRVSRAIRAGTVWVNTYRAVAVQAPFGGFKESGFGRERGDVALDEFTNIRNVMIDFSSEVRDPFAIKR